MISVIFTPFVSKEPVDAGLDSKVMASNAKNVSQHEQMHLIYPESRQC